MHATKTRNRIATLLALLTPGVTSFDPRNALPVDWNPPPEMAGMFVVHHRRLLCIGIRGTWRAGGVVVPAGIHDEMPAGRYVLMAPGRKLRFVGDWAADLRDWLGHTIMVEGPPADGSPVLVPQSLLDLHGGAPEGEDEACGRRAATVMH